MRQQGAPTGSRSGGQRAAGAGSMTAQPARDGWTPVCDVDRLPSDRGVTALVRGHAIAVFRTPDGHVYAIGNHDPASRVGTLGRGIVGTRGDIPFVASTTTRRSFDLRSGRCLDDATVSVPAYAVRVVDGVVQVGRRLTPLSPDNGDGK